MKVWRPKSASRARQREAGTVSMKSTLRGAGNINWRMRGASSAGSSRVRQWHLPRHREINSIEASLAIIAA
jgi:hypothetical protein